VRTSALILADTHIPGFRRELPRSLDPHLAACDVILHAGDVTAPAVLDLLGEHAPVIAVMGNMDGTDLAEWGARPDLVADIGGVAVGMVHDGGRAEGRDQRLMRRFPHAGLIVFGHSHIPSVARVGSAIVLNPGSPTWKRGQPNPTIAVARLSPGNVEVELVDLPIA